MQEKQKDIKTMKVYDSVFWSTAWTLQEYIPYLVNEVFGERFTSKAKVTFKADKQAITLTDGNTEAEYVDALFNISEESYNPIGYDIHFECEVKGTKGIYVRVAKYVTGYAFENTVQTDFGARIIIPQSAVIFLRRESKNIDRFTISVECPAGEMSFNVPIIKIKDYNLDEIFRKKLFILLPFCPFMITQKALKMMDNNPKEKDVISPLIFEIRERLTSLVESKELSSSQEYQILDNLLFVTEKYVINHENVRKEVEEMRKIKLMISEETRNLMKIENMEKQLEVKEQQLEEQKKETQRLLDILKEHNIATL